MASTIAHNPKFRSRRQLRNLGLCAKSWKLENYYVIIKLTWKKFNIKHASALGNKGVIRMFSIFKFWHKVKFFLIYIFFLTYYLFLAAKFKT